MAIAEEEPTYRLRRRAEQALAQGRFGEAAALFRREAAQFRRQGDFGAAKALELRADRWSSDLRLFVHGHAFRPRYLRRQPLARYEPAYGCYVGAFIDRDERLGAPFLDENWQSHRDPEAFARRTGKKLASVFCYVSYGQRCPSR